MNRGVLLVEDEEDLRTLLLETLSERNFRVFGASSGAEALALQEKHHDIIGLVIVDLLLPDMRGNELVGKMSRQAPDLRFLICSGYESSKAMTGLDVAFLAKPFTVDELLHCISSEFNRPAPSPPGAGP